MLKYSFDRKITLSINVIMSKGWRMIIIIAHYFILNALLLHRVFNWFYVILN